MRATWLPLLISFVGGLWAVPEAHALKQAAVVVGIENVPGFEPHLSIPGTTERAQKLGETLRSAGYGRVDVMTGPQATKAGILAALNSALSDLDQGGTLLLIYEGHGIGGDYGDARLLSIDDSPEKMSVTGMDVARIPALLSRTHAGRKLVVITDAVHKGSHAETALIGPVAKDWHNPGSSFAAISATGANQPSRPGVFMEALARGLEGLSDADRDGVVTLGELMAYVREEVGGDSDAPMHPMLAGDLAETHPIATAIKAPAPPVAEAKPGARTSGKLRPAGTGVAAAGVGLGAASLVMYMVKRPDCQEYSQGLVCGDSEGYATYRKIQHATGWMGGIMLVTGTGLWFLDGGAMAVGPGTVRLRGQF